MVWCCLVLFGELTKIASVSETRFKSFINVGDIYITNIYEALCVHVCVCVCVCVCCAHMHVSVHVCVWLSQPET